MEITMTMIGEGIYLINIILAMIIIFRQRRDIVAIWAWLLVLFFTASDRVFDLCFSRPSITQG